MPGWISEHEASYDSKTMVTIRGGQVVQERGGRQRIRRNFEDYALNMKSGVWQRLTDRNWQEFCIRQEKGAFVLEQRPKAEALIPRDVEHSILPCEGNEDARFVVAGVPVSLTIDIMHIDLIVEGNLPAPLSARLVEEIRANTEATIKRSCILEQA
jgi:hypothetical protein